MMILPRWPFFGPEALRLAGDRKRLAIELLHNFDDVDESKLPTWERCAFGVAEFEPLAVRWCTARAVTLLLLLLLSLLLSESVLMT